MIFSVLKKTAKDKKDVRDLVGFFYKNNKRRLLKKKHEPEKLGDILCKRR